MDSLGAGRRTSVMVIPKELPSNALLSNLNKSIKKLEQGWAKFKSTPSTITFLVKDLILLFNSLVQAISESKLGQKIPYIIQIALRICFERISELDELSGKYTARFSRKSLTGENLANLESLFADCKVKLIATQFLIERFVSVFVILPTRG
jgi:hypothetical protein